MYIDLATFIFRNA